MKRRNFEGGEKRRKHHSEGYKYDGYKEGGTRTLLNTVWVHWGRLFNVCCYDLIMIKVISPLLLLIYIYNYIYIY